MSTSNRGLPPGTTPERYMEYYLPRALNRNAERLAEIDCVLFFELTGEGGGDWTLVVRERKARVVRGREGEPRCTFRAAARDWMDLVEGRLNGPFAFMTGRVQIQGDLFFAMRLGKMIMAALAEKQNKG
jgi:putative sterol carrier protein